MSFVELKRFIEECEISVTEDEIKKFLDKKRSENYIGLKVNSKNNGSSILIQEDTTSEELEKTVKDALNYQCCSFDPYTLEYFKKYVAILKVKCSNLLKILDYLDKRKSMEISKDEWKALVDLDIHVNEEGNVYCEDINRLCEAIIYNIIAFINFETSFFTSVIATKLAGNIHNPNNAICNLPIKLKLFVSFKINAININNINVKPMFKIEYIIPTPKRFLNVFTTYSPTSTSEFLITCINPIKNTIIIYPIPNLTAERFSVYISFSNPIATPILTM